MVLQRFVEIGISGNGFMEIYGDWDIRGQYYSDREQDWYTSWIPGDSVIVTRPSAKKIG